ncbi:hypothetical protein B4153_3458 [Bacillus cereus]|jgi:hypothetical protein|nr:conserved hypothetical protein [Bacillus cereus AH820]ADH10126.1 hypothetical protein BMB171_P0234 [Bacillus thuringiensis BMB171]ETT88463.1 hypothetical protein C175_00699 [Bacillus cereus]KLA01124.1 hypothetical protein B4153_3458 [Bacillus cereus]KLA18435.1 hypothetical protein B4087_5744 [Bacillus cereus]
MVLELELDHDNASRKLDISRISTVVEDIIAMKGNFGILK